MTALILKPQLASCCAGGKAASGERVSLRLLSPGCSPPGMPGAGGSRRSQRRLGGRRDRRVWRPLPFPTLPSTGMPLFQAQADWATTTVPSGLPGMKREHCMNETSEDGACSARASYGAFPFPLHHHHHLF